MSKEQEALGNLPEEYSHHVTTTPLTTIKIDSELLEARRKDGVVEAAPVVEPLIHDGRGGVEVTFVGNLFCKDGKSESDPFGGLRSLSHSSTEEGVIHSPQSARAHSAKCLIDGKKEEAITSAIEFVEKVNNPRDKVWAKVNLGDVYYNLENYTEAYKSYASAMDSLEEISVGELQGVRPLLRSDSGRSVASSNSDIPIDINEDRLIYKKIKCLIAQKKFEEAEDLVKDFDSFDQRLKCKSAEIQVGLKKFTEAEAIYDEVISENPDFYLPYYRKGILYLKLEKFKEATELFIKAKEVCTEHGALEVGDDAARIEKIPILLEECHALLTHQQQLQSGLQEIETCADRSDSGTVDASSVRGSVQQAKEKFLALARKVEKHTYKALDAEDDGNSELREGRKKSLADEGVSLEQQMQEMMNEIVSLKGRVTEAEDSVGKMQEELDRSLR